MSRLLPLSFAATLCLAQPAPVNEVWRFDNLTSIGGHPTTVSGHPQIIDTPYGKAAQFNGIDDALFIDSHPLAGAATFTWEVIFHPDADGAAAQRFFHLQERDPKTGEDTATRLLLEIRIVDGKWCLDSYANSAGVNATLLDQTRLYPLGKWYRVEFVYDGAELRNYIDGELQNSHAVKLAPQAPGHSSAGVRINKRDYFKGAILLSRTTPRALNVSEFLELPAPK